MSRVCSQPCPCITASTTAAAKPSPRWMSWGFSREQTPEHNPPGLHVVVVRPRDAVAVEKVEDRPRCWVVDHAKRDVVDQAIGGGCHEEPTVRERWPQARAVPPVGQGERAGEGGV